MRRPTWWGFYNLGLAYSRRGQWDKATENLEIALGSKPGAIYGAFKDKRRAKTYGLHFIDDYFPHRELGICHFHLGGLKAAERELAISLRMIPTARAKHYLNQTRRRLLRQQKTQGLLQPSRPTLEIGRDPPELYVRTPFVHLRGRIASPNRIAAVLANGSPLFIELAEKEFVLDRRLNLPPGRQTVRVAARDLADNRAVWEADVVVDVRGPLVSLRVADSAASGTVTLTVTDENGLQTVRVNGKKSSLSAGSKTFETTVRVARGAKLEVAATDVAGNESTFEASGNQLLKSAVEYRRRHPRRRLAWRGPAQSPVPAAHLTQLADAGPGVLKKAKKDAAGPRIRLFPEVEEAVLVTTEFYVLDVLVGDDAGVATVTVAVNGAQADRCALAPGVTLSRGARRIELQPGKNEVRLRATDRKGNSRTRTFTVERKLGALWRADLRMAAVVLPPDPAPVPALGRIDIGGLMTENLLRDPRRLTLVERDPAILKNILIERELNDAETTSPRFRLRPGAMKPAEWLLHGYLSLWPGAGRQNWDLVAGLLDLESGRTILTADIHCVESSREHVARQIEGLVEKIKQQLPAISAPVARIARGEVVVPLGEKAKILPGMRFLFLPSDGETPCEHADPRTWKDAWIQGVVRKVDPATCLLEVLPRKASKLLDPGDRAVLR